MTGAVDIINSTLGKVTIFLDIFVCFRLFYPVVRLGFFVTQLVPSSPDVLFCCCLLSDIKHI